MVAAMATISGPAAALAALTELSDHVASWLRQSNGCRGVFVLVDENEETSRLITLWETPEDERAARQARGEMRDRLMEMAGLEVVSFDVYEVDRLPRCVCAACAARGASVNCGERAPSPLRRRIQHSATRPGSTRGSR